MPLPSPNLDDRSFNDLVAEALARAPAHVPEWTNPAVGDPGRTIVELFAWLTDALLYRVNLVPARQKLSFLRLLGIQMRPATAATTLISIAIDTRGNTRSQFLPANTSVKGPRPFETRDEVTVLPVIAEAFCKRPRTPDEVTATAAKVDELRRLYSLPAGQEPVPYITTPVFADGKPEEPDGFDLIAGAVDKALWFALLAPDDDAPLDAIKATLGQSVSGGPQYMNIGVSPVIATQAFDEDSGPPTPIPYSIELTTPDPADANGVIYQSLTVAADRSNGLTTDGVIRLVLPGKDAFFAPKNDVRENLGAGTGDLPPRIDDAAKAKRLIAWIRLRPKEDLASLKLIWAGINAIEVDQRESSAGIVVGQGTGRADLEIQLQKGNLETTTFELQVEESNRGFVQWRRIDDLALAEPQQPVFALDPEEGKITFGNGVRGKIPEAGARIRVKQMRSGGGADGNIASGSISAISPNSPVELRLKPLQPLPATGGKNSETVDEALKRIPSVFRHRDRAVTTEDYKQLALTTPGVSVGRVEVLPRFKPQQRRPDVPGVVSVMALPARAGIEAPYPNVDRRFREAIHNFLEARKPLGVELYVIGCEYVKIGLTVGIDNPGGKEEVNTAVKQALQAYLFALPPYGPQNGGWPLGRSVKRRELEIVVSRVEGVEGVSGPNLFVQQKGVWTRVLTPGGAETAEVPLQLWQLPELISVVVAAGEAPEEFKPPGPKSAKDGIPIPVVPEVC